MFSNDNSVSNLSSPYPSTSKNSANAVPRGLGSESGVRADIGVGTGDVVSTYYDPMIAKLIAHGETRDIAVAKLDRALRNFQADLSFR